jgi:hypothetical protein
MSNFCVSLNLPPFQQKMAEYNETWIADYCSAGDTDMSPDVMALCQVHAVSSLLMIAVVVDILIIF